MSHSLERSSIANQTSCTDLNRDSRRSATPRKETEGGYEMKRNELVIAALMGIFAVPARAQPLTGPAMSALSQLADNQKNPEDTFDGMPILRREPPLVIL